MKTFKIKRISNGGTADVHDITVDTNHNYILDHGIITHNSGLDYAADQILFISKSKDRNTAKDVIGNILTFRLQKSRLTKEQTKSECRLSFTDGLHRYYGLLDIAVKYGIVKKVGNKYFFTEELAAMENAIYKNPTKFFTDDILAKINDACKKEFCYGKHDEITTDEEQIDE